MEKRKVALLTWHHAVNYGTALQAYALYRVIEKLGYKVDLIDYRRSGLRTKTMFTYKDFFGECLQKCKSFFKRLETPHGKRFVDEEAKEKFEYFYEDKFSYTASMKSKTELYGLNYLYDAFVCGSDQIWGPEWLDEVFFLNFVKNSKKIAYAPSIGVSRCDDKYVNTFYRNVLKDYVYLSCREEDGCRWLSSILGKEIQHVLDPVLLLSTNEWSELAGNSLVKRNKYMVCLFLAYNRNFMDYAQQLAEEKGLELITFYCTQTEEQGPGNIEGIGPTEYLQIIRDANYICTDSFHCMVFASIFSVPYTVFKKNRDFDKSSKNSRIYSFLKMFNQEYRLYNSKSYDKQKACKFNAVEFSDRLSQLRKKSLEYLSRALEETVMQSCDQVDKEFETYCKIEDGVYCGIREQMCDDFNMKELDERWNYIFDDDIKNVLLDEDTDKRWLKKIICKGDLFRECCYECQKYSEIQDVSKTSNMRKRIRKPIYYDDLRGNVISQRKSLRKVYLKFYFWNDLYLYLKKNN